MVYALAAVLPLITSPLAFAAFSLFNAVLICLQLTAIAFLVRCLTGLDPLAAGGMIVVVSVALIEAFTNPLWHAQVGAAAVRPAVRDARAAGGRAADEERARSAAPGPAGRARDRRLVERRSVRRRGRLLWRRRDLRGLDNSLDAPRAYPGVRPTPRGAGRGHRGRARAVRARDPRAFGPLAGLAPVRRFPFDQRARLGPRRDPNAAGGFPGRSCCSPWVCRSSPSWPATLSGRRHAPTDASAWRSAWRRSASSTVHERSGPAESTASWPGCAVLATVLLLYWLVRIREALWPCQLPSASRRRPVRGCSSSGPCWRIRRR